MFQLLQSWFTSVGDFFQNIWDFIVGVFQEITTFFKVLAPTMQFIRSLFSSIPSVYLAFGIAMLVVLILYVILGRQAGGD